MSIRIPASIDEATTALNGIGALLTAKQWERATIVFAFTVPAESGRNQYGGSGDSRFLTPTEFTRLGIHGLRDDSQVSAYRRAWQSAIDDGQAVAVKPGDQIELPGLPWKEHFGEPTTQVQERIFRQVVRDPVRFQAALRDEPEVIEQVAQRVMETPATRIMAEAKFAEPIREREMSPEPRPQPRRDYAEDLVRGINLLIPVVRAVQRGEWKPSPAAEILLHSLGTLLDQAGSPEGVPQDDLFAQIERYMKEEVR